MGSTLSGSLCPLQAGPRGLECLCVDKWAGLCAELDKFSPLSGKKRKKKNKINKRVIFVRNSSLVFFVFFGRVVGVLSKLSPCVGEPREKVILDREMLEGEAGEPCKP